MLKISETSSVANTKIYWKRFAEWAIGLKRKYQQDLIFRTQWNIIGCIVLLGTSLLALVAYAFHYLYEELTRTILQGVIDQLSTGSAGDGADIAQAAQNAQMRNFVIVFAATALMATLVGYFIAKVALAPARNALLFQKRFIGDIAHELRTPIAIIKTNSEVSLMDTSLDPKVQRVLHSNIDELNRASEIINNLLTFSNWTRPEQMNFSSIDLGVVADAAIRSLRELAKKKRVEIIVYKKTPRMIYANSTAIGQIATNIIKNAISYTPARGKATVLIEPDYQGHILFVVQDTGMGIERKDLPHIFEPFFRAERSRNRQHGSSGLGLAIVSELVKIHHGKIAVKSAPNHGTTVTVSFPYYKNGDAAYSAKREQTEHPDEISAGFVA